MCSSSVGSPENPDDHLVPGKYSKRLTNFMRYIHDLSLWQFFLLTPPHYIGLNSGDTNRAASRLPPTEGARALLGQDSSSGSAGGKGKPKHAVRSAVNACPAAQQASSPVC